MHPASAGVVVLVAGLALQADAAAAAGGKFAIDVAPWSGGAIENARTKTFERCAATRSANEPVRITFAVDRDYRWHMVLADADWNFIRNTRRNVKLRFDDDEIVSAVALAREPGVLELETNDPVSLFAQVRTARRLRVIIGGLLLDLPLDGAVEVLSSLTQCALRSAKDRRYVTSGADLFDVGGAAKPEGGKEAAALATKIIDYSGIAESRLLPPGQGSFVLPVDANWKAGPVTGGVTIVRAPLPIVRISQAIVARALSACKGGFFFITRPEEINKSPIERVFTSCHLLESTTAAHHIVMHRPELGYYVVSVVGVGSSFIGLPLKAATVYEARLKSVLGIAVESRGAD
ncbi:MAG: hypothetical protein IRY89_14835 [Pseudolabrys sp.]|nr:hypothetical protein [Pseudolabrys sp.]